MSRTSGLLSALLAIAITVPIAAQTVALPTATTLTLTSSSILWHQSVYLTAYVTAGGAPVRAGIVTFCNASPIYPHCEDSAIVGQAQITGGSASINITPAIGAHQYTAVFNGTGAAASSVSFPAQTLNVAGLYPTTTSIALLSGNPLGYQLQATVVGFANHPPLYPPLLSGTVSFEDTSNNNFVLGTALLGAPNFAENFVQPPGSPIPTGNQPAASVTGDFDGDGRPDVAVMASVDNAVYILLGNGDGTFRPGTTVFGVGTGPCVVNPSNLPSNCSMAVGDFNHDGALDLAVTSGFDNSVYIILGGPGGTFAPATSIPVGSFPEAVRTGDFNHDGILDLVVANALDNTVSVLLGDGFGGFTPAPGGPVPTGVFPFYLAVADFNQDTFADIAVSNQFDNTVTILLGKGDGTFTQAPGPPIASNYNPAQIVAADFNGDGVPDLAVANFTAVFPSTTGNVIVLLGKGDGTFNPSPGTPISVGLNPLALLAADFNQDGNTDLAVDNYGDITQPQTQTLTVLLGDGKGNFAPLGSPIQLGDSPSDLAAADFNEDGALDLAIPQLANFNTRILLNEFTQTATATASGITIDGIGTHYVDAVYGGNTYFAPSTSFPIPLEGDKVPTSLTLTANPTEQMLTMPVTLTAQLNQLSNLPPFATPTGTVSFFDQSLGGQLLGTQVVDANGQAVFTTTSIGPGVHVISASYGPDPVFLPSNSNQVTVQIDELMIQRVGNNDTTILPGTTVVYTLQVTPEVATAFLYTVSFSASGLPAGAGATFSPPTLAPGGKAAKITMTITTAKAALNLPPSPFARLPLALGLLLPLIGSKAMRRRMRTMPPFMAAVLLAVLSLTAVAGLSGCSGAGLFAQRKVPYPITVTATEGTLQRSTTVPLAIQ